MKAVLYSISCILPFWVFITDCLPTTFTAAPQNEAHIRPPALYHNDAVFTLPYNLNQPDKTSLLSDELLEISGLSLSPDGKSLVAINDEKGTLFFLNKNNGKIIRSVEFAKAGDYEGIESVGSLVYVVNSEGDIYKIKNTDKQETDKKSFKTKLSAENDIEGLAYDQSNNRLFLVCKEKPGEGKRMKDKRAIYAFDLEFHELLEEPIMYIDRRLLHGNFEQYLALKEQGISLSETQKAADFGPSGIAIHPLSQDIYIISSVGKLLVVLSPNGQLKYFKSLDAMVFPQPEGICFGPDGTLYISSEGRDKKAKLLRFQQK